MPQKIVDAILSQNKRNVLCDVLFDDTILEIIEKEDVPLNLPELVDYTCNKRKSHDVPSGIIDANFCIVLPGAIDPHVHYDDPGFEWREDFYTGTLAAAYGGITIVADMPCTSIPPVINKANLQHKLRIIEKKAIIDFALWGGVSGTELADDSYIRNMHELNNEGVIGFKTYLISGMEKFNSVNEEQLEKIAVIAKKLNLPVGVHAEDKNLIEQKRAQFQKENSNEIKHYCQTRNIEAEVQAIKTVIRVAEKTGAYFHIVHLSSKNGLKLIGEAQDKGLYITTETCPHFLSFTQDDFEEQGSILKTAPSIKFKEDRRALWDGLKTGTISFVTTDHAGCDFPREKQTGNIWTDYGGIPGSELMVPYMFSEGFMKGKLDLHQTQKVLCENAANIFGLNTHKGKIEQGKDADFILIDPTGLVVIDQSKLHSKGKYSPFDGRTFKGKIISTYLRGQRIIYDDRFVGNAGEGSFCRPIEH
ncbi:MAG: allantoinase AllB [Candidatus Cloacimonetes bacterium]|nr:allantoinase AllB [Candidatus Cloacimonadota bacterium]